MSPRRHGPPDLAGDRFDLYCGEKLSIGPSFAIVVGGSVIVLGSAVASLV